jgi:ribosomal protein S12 methylthiotransferase
MLIERYRPDLEKKEIPNVDQFWNYWTTQLLKALGADYKHEF